MEPDIIDFLKKNRKHLCFLLDSGAFTAWKAGTEIKVDEYCKFIDSLPFKPWRYFTLDKIGDPDGSLKNYETMLKRGFNPIPVFTRGEDPKMIDYYYKTSDVVGVGGLVGTQGNRGFVKGIMKIIGNRKCHWLGFTNKQFVRHYKPFSCDSSSLVMANKFASIELFDVKTGKWHKVSKIDFMKRPSEQILELIRSYDKDPFLLSKNDNWSGGESVSSYLSFRSHVRAQIEIEKRTGTKYFIAPIAFVGLSYAVKSLAVYQEEMRK